MQDERLRLIEVADAILQEQHDVVDFKAEEFLLGGKPGFICIAENEAKPVALKDEVCIKVNFALLEKGALLELTFVPPALSKYQASSVAIRPVVLPSPVVDDIGRSSSFSVAGQSALALLNDALLLLLLLWLLQLLKLAFT